MSFNPEIKEKCFGTNTNLSLIMVLLLALAVFPQVQYAQAKLTLGDLFTGLRSKKATLDEKNRLLTEAIRTRGITFSLTTVIERELEETGAARELIDAIKQQSIASLLSATPSPTPNATPTPRPVQTSVPTPEPTPAPPDFETFQKQGDGNFVKGEYDLAVINYSRAIDLNPKASSIYLSRGLVYYNRKFYDLAIADYSLAIELEPKEMMAYYYRGDSHEKLGELEKAADDFRKVLEFDSNNDYAKTSVKRLEIALSRNNSVDPAPQTKPNEVQPAPVEPDKSAKTDVQTPEFVELGSLTGLVDRLVQPAYPSGLRSLRINGDVTVNITLDEEGNAISVKAVTGHPLLRQVCEDAVKKSRFNPAVFNSKPTKARGFINFKFKL